MSEGFSISAMDCLNLDINVRGLSLNMPVGKRWNIPGVALYNIQFSKWGNEIQFFQGPKLAKEEQKHTFLGNDAWVCDKGGILQMGLFLGSGQAAAQPRRMVLIFLYFREI